MKQTTQRAAADSIKTGRKDMAIEIKDIYGGTILCGDYATVKEAVEAAVRDEVTAEVEAVSAPRPAVGKSLREYTVRVNGTLDIQAVVKEFRAHGFAVTEKAVEHNYTAWCADYKSGYRDDANGYFLFSPCGCNALRFEAVELGDNLDWQKTYIA